MRNSLSLAVLQPTTNVKLMSKTEAARPRKSPGHSFQTFSSIKHMRLRRGQRALNESMRTEYCDFKDAQHVSNLKLTQFTGNGLQKKKEEGFN